MSQSIIDQMEDFNIPPHSLEAEQSVLGGLLLKADSFEKVAPFIENSQFFYRHDHRLIWETAVEMNKKNSPMDIITFTDYLKHHGNLEDAGGFAYIGTMAKDTPTAANIVAYAKIIKECYYRRLLMDVGETIKNLPFNPEYVDMSAKELIQTAEKSIYNLSDGANNGEITVHKMKPSMIAVLRGIHERSQRNDDELLGVSTGFNELDIMTSGLVPGDLTIVAARPSMGKTAFAGDLELAAANADVPVLCFTMEMPTEQILMRILSKSSNVPLQKIRKSWTMEEIDFGKLTHVSQPLVDLPFFVVDHSNLSPSEMRSIIRRVQRESQRLFGKALGLITVDYIQLMTADNERNSFTSRAEKVSSISRELKGIARDFSVPVVALSQLNRSLEARPNKRPIMSDLRESGAIEQDADNILFIYRDEVYNPDSNEKGQAEIIIAKQRNGPIGTVRLVFQGECVRFKDFTPDVYSNEGK